MRFMGWWRGVLRGRKIVTEDAINEYLKKSEFYLKEVIISKRGFIQNLCLISAAVASFSMPLFMSSFIDRSLLLLGVTFLSFVIIVGCYLLKWELETENDNIMEMRKAVIERNAKSIENIYNKYQAKKDKKDYTLDFMVYPLCGGIIAIFLALLFGIVLIKN